MRGRNGTSAGLPKALPVGAIVAAAQASGGVNALTFSAANANLTYLQPLTSSQPFTSSQRLGAQVRLKQEQSQEPEFSGTAGTRDLKTPSPRTFAPQPRAHAQITEGKRRAPTQARAAPSGALRTSRRASLPSAAAAAVTFASSLSTAPAAEARPASRPQLWDDDDDDGDLLGGHAAAAVGSRSCPPLVRAQPGRKRSLSNADNSALYVSCLKCAARNPGSTPPLFVAARLQPSTCLCVGYLPAAASRPRV